MTLVDAKRDPIVFVISTIGHVVAVDNVVSVEGNFASNRNADVVIVTRFTTYSATIFVAQKNAGSKAISNCLFLC